MKRIIVLLVMLIAIAGCNQSKEKRPVPQQSAPQISAEEIRRLQATANMSPKDPTGWIELGNALMDSNQFKEAGDAYQKALALSPNNVDVRVDLGTCYRNLGQPQKALQEYRKAIAMNPDHPNARRNSGVVLAFDLKDGKQAIPEFEKYLALAPNAPDAVQVKQLVQKLKEAH